MRATIKPLGIRAVICKSIFSKFRGMMFRRCRNAEAMIFEFGKEKKIPIHMLFVFFPIAVLWLDRRKKVVERGILMPFQAYFPKKGARFVVEIPIGGRYSEDKLMKVKKLRW